MILVGNGGTRYEKATKKFRYSRGIHYKCLDGTRNKCWSILMRGNWRKLFPRIILIGNFDEKEFQWIIRKNVTTCKLSLQLLKNTMLPVLKIHWNNIFKWKSNINKSHINHHQEKTILFYRYLSYNKIQFNGA